VRHRDGGPQDAAVGAHPGDRLGELDRRDRSDLAASIDPRRGEAGIEEAGDRLAVADPTEQQQPGLALTRGRTA